MEWLPIDSAPKEGEEIQLWGEEGWTPQAHWCARKQGWYASYWDADWHSEGETAVYGATHWMRVPSHPLTDKP